VTPGVDQTLLILRFVLAALLYGFLAVALYVMWRGLRPGGRDESVPYEPATLTIESESLPESTFSLRAVTAIGRAADNHLVLNDPFASANHVIVVWRDNRWWVEDLNSHNGTYLNGERIDKPRQLADGDRIGVGETVLRFEGNV
jgi:pSer/pThr/pTyr-binding forkhead associated (FHA) protein